MADAFTAVRRRQLARLGGAKPPAQRAAIALAKSQAYPEAADAPATLRAYDPAPSNCRHCSCVWRRRPSSRHQASCDPRNTPGHRTQAWPSVAPSCCAPHAPRREARRRQRARCQATIGRLVHLLPIVRSAVYFPDAGSATRSGRLGRLSVLISPTTTWRRSPMAPRLPRRSSNWRWAVPHSQKKSIGCTPHCASIATEIHLPWSKCIAR
jgi:hypothetical protein